MAAFKWTIRYNSVYPSLEGPPTAAQDCHWADQNMSPGPFNKNAIIQALNTKPQSFSKPNKEEVASFTKCYQEVGTNTANSHKRMKGGGGGGG